MRASQQNSDRIPTKSEAIIKKRRYMPSTGNRASMDSTQPMTGDGNAGS